MLLELLNRLRCSAAVLLQAAAMLGYPLTWGGNWRSWQDMPHFQLEE